MSRLYPCVYCTEDGYCKKYSDEEVTAWCVQSPCKDEKQSNADRIRSMTDEELADWIYGQSDEWSNWCPREAPINPETLECLRNGGDCGKCILDWLKEEAKE